MTTPPSTPSSKPPQSFVEFVVLVAMLMALGAFGIDSMLPNLPAIGRALHVADENRRQLVITTYLLGLGVSQLIFGPLADRFGRRPVLLAGLSLYLVFSLLAALSPTFNLLLLARVLQGVGAAATRAVPVAIVRDRYAGREMARVLSLTSLVFMGAPIIAPSLGQFVVMVASWPWIFGVLACFALGLMLWVLLRLPETQHPEDRLPINLGRIAGAFATAARTRTSLCYILAQAFLFGGLLGFITSAQQVVAEALGAGVWFPLIFAACASFIAVASLLNARLVMRIGMRRLSHAALLAYIAIGGLHLAIAASGHETLVVFIALQASIMFTFGLTSGNFGAIAMEPMGHIAGVASSFQGFVSTVGAALIGLAIGQAFNGTVMPLELGYALCGLCALTVVLIAENGKLFQAHEPHA